MRKLITLFFVLIAFAPVAFATNDSTQVAPNQQVLIPATGDEDEAPAVAENEPVAKLSKKDIVKKGISFGPLPVVAFDQDRGFQYGALLNLYDFGDGSHYPNPRQQWYFEVSFYTKGTQQYIVSYDTRFLIPGIRLSAAATYWGEKAVDFYGFNGYQADVKDWKRYTPEEGQMRPVEYTSTYYRHARDLPTAKVDLIGNIWDNKLFWEAGYHFAYYGVRGIDYASVNKGRDSLEMFYGPTLYDKYLNWGIIPEDQAKGGFSSALRLGLKFDTRDIEAAPNSGIWAEAHAVIAPKFLGTTHPYYRYSATFRHYVPIVRNQLTFAYRLNYQGTIGNSAPWYVLPFFTNVGPGYDRDGVGGYRTARGLMRNRLQGLDVFFGNVELRWKFINFTLWKQNISLGLNGFFDAGMVTRQFDTSYKPTSIMNTAENKAEYDEYMSRSMKESLHMAAGGGFRFIMNQNFIVAFEYGMPFSRKDGFGSLYINTGYLF